MASFFGGTGLRRMASNTMKRKREPLQPGNRKQIHHAQIDGEHDQQIDEPLKAALPNLL